MLAVCVRGVTFVGLCQEEHTPRVFTEAANQLISDITAYCRHSLVGFLHLARKAFVRLRSKGHHTCELSCWIMCECKMNDGMHRGAILHIQTCFLINVCACV